MVTATDTDSGEYVFEDVFVNADGNPVETRSPQRGTSQSAYVSKTLYKYEEMNASGNAGWNKVLPAFWGLRSNLVEIKEVPGFLTYEADVNDYSSAKITSITYEPLFNQNRSVTYSKDFLAGGRVDLFRVSNEFDYQEFAGLPTGDVLMPDTDPLGSALFKQILNGKHWAFKESNGSAVIDNVQGILDWQFTTALPDVDGTQSQDDASRLEMVFYDRDLNGDGRIGTLSGTAPEGKGALALPVRILMEDLTSNVDNTRYVYASWSPSGMPAAVLLPNGKHTSYYYYPVVKNNDLFDDRFGLNSEPIKTDTTDSKIDQSYRGLLAQISWNEFDNNYPTNLGPDRLNVNSTICEALKGPYQWMIQECGSGDFSDHLTALNIPAETIEDLERTQTNPKRRISLSYNHLGLPYRIWQNGRMSEVSYDSDGRMVKHIDVKGNISNFEYTIDGWPSHERSQGPNNTTTIYETFRSFDNEGRVRAECTSLIPGACDENFTVNLPQSGQPSPSGTQIEQFFYTNEGQLSLTYDPEGTPSYYYYDKRKRLKESLVLDGSSTPSVRKIKWTYDDRNRVLKKEYGDASEPGQFLQEGFVYDDYHRLISKTDSRGTPWQYAYTAKGELSKMRQSSTAYDKFDNTSSDYFVEYTYNGFSEPVYQNQHGIIETTWSRYPDGRIASVSTTGGGTTYMSFDTDGNQVWQQAPHFDQILSVANPGHPGLLPRASTITIARKRKGKDYLSAPSLSSEFLTLTSHTRFNKNYEATFQKTTANDGKSFIETWDRSPLGYVTKFRNAEGRDTEFSRNLLGWPTQERRERDSGIQITNFNYNARGQRKTLYDPSGQLTTWNYNLFGDLVSEIRPGSTTPFISTQYDHLGRVSSQTKADGEHLNFVYNTKGDPIQKIWTNSPVGSSIMSQRSFDILGRVTSETNFNLALVDVFNGVAVGDKPDKLRTEIVNSYTYDALGRLLHDTRENGAQTMDFDYQYTASDKGWARLATMPSGDTLEERTDLNGRVMLSTVDVNGEAHEHRHNYMGGINLGRSMTWDPTGIADPLEFSKQLDGFGRPVGWSISALRLNNGAPTNSSWADEYCNGIYDSDRCSKPLMKISTLRDVMGRIRSRATRFSFPMLGDAGPLPDSDHVDRWKGFEYTSRGFLGKVWEKEGTPVDTSTLTPNFIVNSHVNILGTDVSADPWKRIRDASVGSLQRIENSDTLEVRWQTQGRGAGHRLTEINVDMDPADPTGQTLQNYVVEHDASGRVTKSLDFELVYDADDRLVAAYDKDGNLAETYAYDASGRLSVVYQPNGQYFDSFGYDGSRMAIAYITDDAFTDLHWQTFYGPQQDQILEFYGDDYASIPIQDERNNVVGAWRTLQRNMIYTATYNEEGRRSLYYNEALLCDELGNEGVVCSNLDQIPFAMNGLWRSEVTGFVNMRARWYSPRMGEFLSHDPLGYIDLYNLYGFASYDGINGWDPYGTKIRGFVEGVAEGVGEIVEENKGCMLAGPLGGPPCIAYKTGKTMLEEVKKGKDIPEKIERAINVVNPLKPAFIGFQELLNGLAQDDYRMVGKGAFQSALGVEGAAGLALGGVAAARKLKVPGTKGNTKIPLNNETKCFKAGTLIDTPEGKKAIEDLEVGDRVWAYDFKTQKRIARRVKHLIPGETKKWVHLLTSEGEIITTPGHDFWVESLGEWRDAQDLLPEMELRTSEGKITYLISLHIEELDSAEATYNFEVEENHNYYVGQEGVLVHNAECGVDKFGNKIIREPRTLQDQMALEAAKGGQGIVKISNLGDPKYKGMDKMELRIISSGGKKSNVHYVRDPKTGKTMDFKFKTSSADYIHNYEKDPNRGIR